MSQYAKGKKPRDLEAAVGGLVLDRHRSFLKDPDDFHPMGTGVSGPENVQEYGKHGKTDKIAKRTGDKSAAVIKPRK